MKTLIFEKLKIKEQKSIIAGLPSPDQLCAVDLNGPPDPKSNGIKCTLGEPDPANEEPKPGIC